MTLSASTSEKRSGLRHVLAAFDDGVILRFAFFAMLAGTVSVLYLDYRDLQASAPLPETGHLGDPVLPAVERPEIDPSNPAYRPQERITTPEAVLSAPLSVELIAGGVLQLTGTIGAGSAAAFLREVEMRGAYVETVALNSPGGSVEDALAIADRIAEAGFDTVVADGALCASSCPLILAAGAERIVADSASVGVHQIYASVADAGRIGVAQAMSDAQMITARITRHLDRHGIDPAVWVHALETPPDRLYYFTPDEMAAYNLSTAR